MAQNGHALGRASSRLKADQEVVLAAVAQNGNALDHAPKKLRANRKVVLAAVAQHGNALQYAYMYSALKADREVRRWSWRRWHRMASPCFTRRRSCGRTGRWSWRPPGRTRTLASRISSASGRAAGPGAAAAGPCWCAIPAVHSPRVCCALTPVPTAPCSVHQHANFLVLRRLRRSGGGGGGGGDGTCSGGDGTCSGGGPAASASSWLDLGG